MAKGEITLLAVPGMLDEYSDVCIQTFQALGVEFTRVEVENLRAILRDQLAEAFGASSRSYIVITYESPTGSTIDYHVRAQWTSIEQAYAARVETGDTSLFGRAPDARVLELARSQARPCECRILDIGAGTGRNALPLARLGHPVDAIELTGRFADALEAEGRRESLDLRVFRGDALANVPGLHSDYRIVVASEVTSDFRTDAQLRRLFHLASTCLAPGGFLVMNAFVARPGYAPDQVAVQLSQQVHSTIFTRAGLASAVEGLGLTLLSDESEVDFERLNSPPGDWPPTVWFEDWANGRDVYSFATEDSPIELRWLLFEKGA